MLSRVRDDDVDVLVVVEVRDLEVHRAEGQPVDDGGEIAAVAVAKEDREPGVGVPACDRQIRDAVAVEVGGARGDRQVSFRVDRDVVPDPRDVEVGLVGEGGARKEGGDDTKGGESRCHVGSLWLRTSWIAE